MLTLTCLSDKWLQMPANWLPSGCLSKWLQVTAKPKIKMYVICPLSVNFAKNAHMHTYNQYIHREFLEDLKNYKDYIRQ